jgi:Transposase IS116/IS110/IS902 family
VSWISLEDKYYLQKEGQDLRQKVDSAVNNSLASPTRLIWLLGRACVRARSESAGKRQNGRSRPGNKYVKSALVQAAHATAHTKTYLGEQYRRLRVRRGAKRAAIAVGHSILVIFYQMMTTGESYQEKEADFFEHRERGQLEKRLVQRLEHLGYEVIQPQSPAPAL